MSLTSTRVILTPQALGRLVDHDQQPGVDLVALGEGLVEVHRAHDGTQVRRGELHDRGIEVADFICGLCRVEHLEEDDSIDADHGVVLGDDLLPRNVEHLLHHVHPAADAVEEGREEVQPGPRDRGEAAEIFYRILIALPDDLYTCEQVQQAESDQNSYGAEHRFTPLA